MAGREISVKKYVVKLSAEEREQLEAMVCAGKHPAQSLTKARILLKADVSEAGEGWSDSAISAALDTSINMAESELGVLSSQCLSRRIPDKPTLEKEVAAWEDHRNKHHAKANWQFTTDDARVKLKRLYPSF